MSQVDAVQTQSWNPKQESAVIRESLNISTVENWLGRVRGAAIRDKSTRFTALFHQLKPEMLRRSFEAINPKAVAGVDGVTYKEYKEDLDANLEKLCQRVQNGAYIALPGLRKYIPKSDGVSLRPLGIAALEDKIVQQAVAEILSTIYEVDFSPYSYGFRPIRGCHDALDELYMSITCRKVSWVLDADIKKFFDSISHQLMLSMLKVRVGDPRILKLVDQWLNAGYIEDNNWHESDVGSAQGAVISPLLANIFLHYALDGWVEEYKLRACGEIHYVRYADDFVVGFQYKDEAIKFWDDLKKRLEEFELVLHPDKTRLLEFGRFAAINRRRRGEGKPETFDFLGFTHICSVTRKNKKFKLLRITIGKRWRAKLKDLKEQLRKRINWKIEWVGKWLRRVVAGYFNYYAVPDNSATLGMFRYLLARIWMKTIRRRSHKCTMTWDLFKPIAELFLPPPTPIHCYPSLRYNARIILLRSLVR
jgi:group II intron reverse transcriptase/maturase